MKRILYIALALLVAVSMMPLAVFGEGETASSADVLYAAVDGVPVTNGKVFVGNGGSVQLTGDSAIRNRAITIGDGNTWVLDLNGFSLTLGADLTVSNKSTLTVIDSSTDGSGRLTFENGGILISGSSGEGIIGSFKEGNVNYEDEQRVHSTANLNGGLISAVNSPTVRVLGNGATLSVDGANVFNSTTAAITTGIKKENGGVTVSVFSGSVTSAGGPAIRLQSYGAYLISGNNTNITGTSGVEISSGNLRISGQPNITGNGESSLIRNDSTGSAFVAIVQNAASYYGKLNVQIDGGVFTSTNAYAIDEFVSENAGTNLAEISRFTVNGGYFSGGEGAVRTDILKNFIAGGYYSSSPAKWLKGGYTIAAATDSSYKYKVLKGEANVNGAVAEVVASVFPVSTADNAVQSVADTIRENISELIGFDTLKALSWTMFNDSTIFTADLSKQARTELSAIGAAPGSTYSIANPLFVIFPYFDINVISANASTGKIELTIEAKYDLYATTADDPASMVKSGAEKNSVKLSSYATMKFSDPVEINLPLPKAFAQALEGKFYVKHTPAGSQKSYIYEGSTKNYAAYFDVGRSEFGLGTFVINTDAPAAQIVGGQTLYTSLQECVDNLKDGETISILKPGEAVFSKVLTFRVVDNGNKFTFKAGNGYEITVGEDGLYRVNERKTYFKDIKKEEYYYNAVIWAVDNKIAMGISDTQFVPDGDCTRAQVVTFLWRAAGSPSSKGITNPFTDVKASDYYLDAVLWAVQNGITTGINDTSFAPSSIVTRAQFVTFLARYASNIDLEDESDVTDEHPFKDLKDGAYYVDPVIWAYQRGITTGASADTFKPEGTCTRGQTVTFIYRYFYK